MIDRVLIVEDNAALAENMAEILVDEGVHVQVAEGEREALALASSHGFDLAIVDLRLSAGESGLDLVPLLRGHSAHGEFLLVTGNATLDTAIQAIRRGVYAYLTKPFEPEQLVTLVKRALAQVALKREKHALQQRLEASEALYRSVVETVEACILGLDSKGRVRFANRFALERLQKSGDEVVTEPFSSLFEARDRAAMERALARATQGQPVRDLEVRVDTGSPRMRTIRWTLTPLDGQSREAALRSEPAELPVVLASGLDITDRLDLERKTAEAEAMAAMGALTTGLAHEIRNPLNAAKLQLELLIRRSRRSTSTEAQAQLIEPAELVKSEIDRLSSLLDEFLDLARPRPLQRKACSVAELFSSVLKLEEPVAQHAHAVLSAHVAPEDLTVHCDPDKLKQVLINLVGNAVDAVRERKHGKVELCGELEGSHVVISVKDDGPGVPSEILDSAFKPFITTKPAGTGLGLAIVHKIVTQHGGYAELSLLAEGGTVARFFLPV
jgi:PAS domain S-box-containing protein